MTRGQLLTTILIVAFALGLFGLLSFPQTAPAHPCAERGRDRHVRFVACPPDSSRAAMRDAGRRICADETPCNAWIWIDAAHIERTTLPMSQRQADCVAAVWVGSTRQLQRKRGC